MSWCSFPGVFEDLLEEFPGVFQNGAIADHHRCVFVARARARAAYAPPGAHNRFSRWYPRCCTVGLSLLLLTRTVRVAAPAAVRCFAALHFNAPRSSQCSHHALRVHHAAAISLRRPTHTPYHCVGHTLTPYECRHHTAPRTSLHLHSRLTASWRPAWRCEGRDFGALLTQCQQWMMRGAWLCWSILKTND